MRYGSKGRQTDQWNKTERTEIGYTFMVKLNGKRKVFLTNGAKTAKYPYTIK